MSVSVSMVPSQLRVRPLVRPQSMAVHDSDSVAGPSQFRIRVRVPPWSMAGRRSWLRPDTVGDRAVLAQFRMADRRARRPL